MGINFEQKDGNKTHNLSIKEIDNKLKITANDFSVIGGATSGEYTLNVYEAMKLKDLLDEFIKNH